MSVKIMSLIWDMTLPPSEKLVLLAMADWARDDGRCWPSIKALADKSGVSERTVQRMLREAETTGLIFRNEVRGKGCEYRFAPRHSVTPDKVAPVTNEAETPDTVSPNTLGHVRSEAKASSLWHPLPIGWYPTRELSPSCQAKVAQWPPGAFDDELESFRAWAANAAPTKGKGLKKDWDDAFANWIRRQHRDRYSRQQSNPRTSNPTLDILRAANAQLARSEAGQDYCGTWAALPPTGTG